MNYFDQQQLKANKPVNCGAICPDCQTQAIHYGILNGNYNYQCTDCGGFFDKSLLIIK